MGRGRDPETDLIDLDAGRTLLVSAFLRNKRWHQGLLVLDLSRRAEPIVWRPWPRGPEKVVPSPAMLGEVRPFKITDGISGPGGDFVVLEVDAANDHHRFAIPITDLPLIRAAFERAAPQAPGSAPTTS
jgi:hypothetical protein